MPEYDGGDVARGQVTLLRGSALEVLRAFPGTTSTESVLAMHEALTEAHEVIRELLQFVPYEKPEQGALPQWITDARERADAALPSRETRLASETDQPKETA